MKMLVIQTGDATAAAKKYGNFNDWFQHAVPDKLMYSVHVHRGETLPEFSWVKDHCSHIIITGSVAMITEQQSWMVKTQHWLANIIDDVPILGVCFGHQLLADLLGGEVKNNPKGRNMGLSECELTEAGLLDPLFKFQSQKTIKTWVSHLQAVKQLPSDAKRLAVSDMDSNHAFRYKSHVYGVQFHPEWNSNIMQAYIRDRAEVLTAEGHDTTHILQTAQVPIDGSALIRQFINKI